MIFVVDNNDEMANCIARACHAEVRIFLNAIDAMNEISNGVVPQLIFLDILLDGPDGFTFLNELASYDDTAGIPVVIVSSFDYCRYNLAEYGVIGVLNKDIMTPEEIRRYVENYAK